MRRRQGPGSRQAVALLLLSGLATSDCAQPAPEAARHRGPIVLVTFEGLREDAVSGLGGDPALTPRFRELLGRPTTWGGRGIASSSCSEASAATLLTGLQPWLHQVLAPGIGELPSGVRSLAEALKAAGYRTIGFGSNREVRLGLSRGFDEFGDVGKGWPAAARLSRLTGGRDFVWIHLPEPRAPYVRRDWLLGRLVDAPARLPARLTQAQVDGLLESSAADPGVHRMLWAMYRLNAAWADDLLGRLLDALAASGQRDRTLLAVTSLRGEDFGPGRFGGRDGGLGRQMLEVPLAIELPLGGRGRIAEPSDRPVGLARLWATIAEAAGADVPPAAAPSLFRASGPAILSELYGGSDGKNRFSLVSGSDQLLWEVPFAPAGAPEAALEAGFAAMPPLTGGPAGQPALRLLRWGPVGSRPVGDPARMRALAARLAFAWRRFVPEELSPAAEARLRGVPSRFRSEPGAILPSRPAGVTRVHSSAVRATGS